MTFSHSHGVMLERFGPYDNGSFIPARATAVMVCAQVDSRFACADKFFGDLLFSNDSNPYAAGGGLALPSRTISLAEIPLP
jgi:hypothetical protein